MKKSTAVLLAVLIALSLFPLSSFAAASTDETADAPALPKDAKTIHANNEPPSRPAVDEESADISVRFTVGSGKLTVNGEELEMEPPYIVNGTTLVPLRVITEAFGAEVEWESESQTIVLTYEEVLMMLKIGETKAVVNGEVTDLPVAPELKNDVSMVPLRFITESFGADVTYNEETKEITVTKEGSLTDGSIKDYAAILKRSKKERLGDSFHVWSIERSPDIELEIRSFDCTSYAFSVMDGEASISVDMERRSDYADYETTDDFLDSLRDYGRYDTVMDLEKGKTPGGTEYVKVRTNSDYSLTDFRYYIGKDYVFSVTADTSSDDRIKALDRLGELVDTFELNFDAESMEDLSDIDLATGLHDFKSYALALYLKVPADFGSSYGTKSNQVSLYRRSASSSEYDYDDYYGYDSSSSISTSESIDFEVYSSFATHTGKDWATYDYGIQKGLYSSKYVKISPLTDTTVNEKKAVFYTVDMNLGNIKTSSYFAYVEAGNYFYHVAITLAKSETSAELLKNMLASIEIGELNAEERGRILRTDKVVKELKFKELSMKKYKVKVEVPESWDGYTYSGSLSVSDSQSDCNFYVYASKIPEKSKYKDLTTEELFNELEMSSGILDMFSDYTADTEIVEKKNITDSKWSKDVFYVSMLNKSDDAEDAEADSKTEIYLVEKDGILYLVEYSISLIFDGETNRAVHDKLFSTLSIG